MPVGVYGFLAPFWCLPSAILRGAAAAAGIAFVNSFGNLGGLVGPYALGALKDATGSTTGALLGLAMDGLGSRRAVPRASTTGGRHHGQSLGGGG